MEPTTHPRDDPYNCYPNYKPPPVRIQAKDDNSEYDDEYEVEKIIKHRVVRGRKQYLIRWKDYSPIHDSWYNEDDLPRAQELIDEYTTC